MENDEHNLQYIKPPKRSNTRRAKWHDYRQPCIYMITLSKHPEAPIFGSLLQTGPKILLTETGQTLRDAINGIHYLHPEIRLLREVVMPDHVHFVIYVTRRTEQPLGAIIQKLKANVTGQVRRRLSNPNLNLFQPNFHDRILRGRDQLRAMIRYVHDNPRRLYIRHRNPDLFRRINRLNINGIKLLAFGNLFLLRDFDRCPVAIHRSLSILEKQTLEERWLAVASTGGVLVSPFISPEEKEIRRKALALGGRLIVISQQAVGERFKPSGSEFDLCAQGRLLLLFPWPRRVKNPGITRTEALWMNRIAEIICIPESNLSFSPTPQSSAVHGR